MNSNLKDIGPYEWIIGRFCVIMIYDHDRQVIIVAFSVFTDVGIKKDECR